MFIEILYVKINAARAASTFKPTGPVYSLCGRMRRLSAKLFQHVSRPTGRSRDGKDRREQVGRNAERVINGGGIEIDVGVEIFAS